MMLVRRGLPTLDMSIAVTVVLSVFEPRDCTVVADFCACASAD